MKTSNFPSLRVDPELREAAEAVLEDGESLSAFIETSVRQSIARRQHHNEFLARGLASRAETQRTGVLHPASDVHAELDVLLQGAKRRVKG